MIRLIEILLNINKDIKNFHSCLYSKILQIIHVSNDLQNILIPLLPNMKVNYKYLTLTPSQNTHKSHIDGWALGSG